MTKKIIKEIIDNHIYKNFELKRNYGIKSDYGILFEKFKYILVTSSKRGSKDKTVMSGSFDIKRNFILLDDKNNIINDYSQYKFYILSDDRLYNDIINDNLNLYSDIQIEISKIKEQCGYIEKFIRYTPFYIKDDNHVTVLVDNKNKILYFFKNDDDIEKKLKKYYNFVFNPLLYSAINSFINFGKFLFC